jgi:hypothetical protein
VLHELIFDLAADGVPPVAAQAVGLAERVPGQVERVVLARLGRLDKAAVWLAQAVAVLGEGSGLRLVAVLAERSIDDAAGAADALVTAELFAADRPLRFAHPLVRSAIYEQIPPVRAPEHTHVPPICWPVRAPCLSRSRSSCWPVSQRTMRTPYRR